jgi:hypothetical protein
MSRDWFRRKSWSPRDANEFFARLERSRSDFHKAQYLRLQAFELQHAEGRRLKRVALQLLDKLIREYPEPSQLASAYLQRAECLVDLEGLDAGLESYRASFVAMREHPNFLPSTHLDFGWAVVVHDRADLIDEALNALEEFSSEGDFMFPANAYRYFAVVAFASHWGGDLASAARFAQYAVDQAAKSRNVLARHSKLGLVRNPDRRINQRLKEMARSP